jgi:nucleoid DNA-binding protein
MNKTEIVKAVNSQVQGQTLKSVLEIIDTVIEVITAELKANNKVSFQGFLTIENRLIKGRSGELAGHKWQTNDRLIPKVKIMKKFQKEIQDAQK